MTLCMFYYGCKHGCLVFLSRVITYLAVVASPSCLQVSRHAHLKGETSELVYNVHADRRFQALERPFKGDYYKRLLNSKGE